MGGGEGGSGATRPGHLCERGGPGLGRPRGSSLPLYTLRTLGKEEVPPPSKSGSAAAVPHPSWTHISLLSSSLGLAESLPWAAGGASGPGPQGYGSAGAGRVGRGSQRKMQGP